MLRLPTELRVKIFEMVVGCRRWHVVSKPGPGRDRNTFLKPCYARKMKGAESYKEQCYRFCHASKRARTRPRKDSTLDLLLTCRQFYTEAAKLWFQNHVFQIEPCFDDDDILELFVRRLSTVQRKMIRVLHIMYIPGQGTSQDVAMTFLDREHMNKVSEMINLRYLAVAPRIHFEPPQIYKSTWATTGSQLMPMRVLETERVIVHILAFDRVYIPWDPPAPLRCFDVTQYWRDCVMNLHD